jgi:hypothetical protein
LSEIPQSGGTPSVWRFSAPCSAFLSGVCARSGKPTSTASIEQESFAYIFAEVTVASIVGALLFAVVAEIRNRLSFRADHVAAKKDQHRPR